MTSLARLEAPLYAALRIVTGFLFSFHGVQKVLGEFTTRPTPAVMSQAWIGGLIELVGGVLIALGLLTRPAAFVCAGTMAVAYFQFHVGKHWQSLEHWLPVVNGGELAVLYCFVFLLIFARGPGVLALDNRLGRRNR